MLNPLRRARRRREQELAEDERRRQEWHLPMVREQIERNAEDRRSHGDRVRVIEPD